MPIIIQLKSIRGWISAFYFPRALEYSLSLIPTQGTLLFKYFNEPLGGTNLEREKQCVLQFLKYSVEFINKAWCIHMSAFARNNVLGRSGHCFTHIENRE